MRAIKIPASPAGRKTRNIIVLFFSLFLTLAVFSQISAASPKPKPGFGGGDWLYYKANNDLTAYLGKKSSSLPTVRYQKGGDYLEFSMIKALKTDISSTTSVSLETNTKTPNTPTLFYRNILDGVDANYQITNLPFKIKEEIVLKQFPISNFQFPINDSISNSQIENSSLSFLFSAETSAKPVKQDDGSIAFFGDNDEYLFQLDKPFMIDAEGERSEEVSIEITPVKEAKPSLKNNTFNYQLPIFNFQSRLNDLIFKPFSSLKISNWKFNENWPLKIENSSPTTYNPTPTTYTIILKADSEWLSTATYPVIIDPTVTHNADANFTGQFNRIADSDTTSSTKLESSYPEAVKDPYTVLLLHFNEANGTTAGIKDYASTTRVITANGSASTTSAVTQLGLGNSAAFDGTGDYFSAPDSEDWNFGTRDFTMDFWVNFKSFGNGNNPIIVQGADNNNHGYITYSNTSGFLRFRAKTGAVVTIDYTPSWSPSVNTWYHIALIRNSDNFIFFVNGVPLSPTIDADAAWNYSSNLEIGGFVFGNDYLNGYLDSVRILKGRALTPEEIKAAASRRPYAVYTSPVVDAAASVAWNTVNWTEGGVNTGDGETPYSANSLVAQWDFNETSGTTLTASSSGSCTTACNGTLTNFASTASQDQAAGTGWTANNKKWGAGALMMGSAATADYVSIANPASNALDPGTGDFSVEGWIKSSATGQDTILQNNTTVGACASNAGYILIVNGNRNLAAYASDGTTCYVNNLTANASSTEIADGRWHHFAFVADRDTKAYVYYDGRLATSTTISNTTAANPAATIYFGASGATGDSDFILDSARYYSRALSAAEALSNYQAGNIEIQTRTGATSDPNDGTWEAWKPTTGETQLLSMDSDAVNWHSDIMASTTIATSTDTTIKMEGTGSLKIRTGMASTTAGVVALWHFEETGTTTGTYLYDETANNNDATTTGTTVVDGIFGKARKFNGTSDYVSVGDTSTFKFLHGAEDTSGFKWSADFWVKMNTFSDYEAFFGTVPLSSGTVGTIVYVDSNRNLGIWMVYGVGGQNIISATAGTYPNDSNWHHIAFTYDQSLANSNFKAYIDGALSGSGSKSGNTPSTANSDTALHVGSSGNRGIPTYFLDSSLDEFRILKGRALTADEIAETYRMGANHHLTRQVSAVDLSGANKLAFNVASDRPGTYLETMLGESDYANYELASSTLALSTNTVLYIKGDEIASSTSLKDSSFSGKAITANGNARTAGGGKIGNAMYFDGTGDYLTVADSEDFTFGSGDFTIDLWVNLENISSHRTFYDQTGAGSARVYVAFNFSTGLYFRVMDSGGTNNDLVQGNTSGWSINKWYHIVAVRQANNLIFYRNGVSLGSIAINSFNENLTSLVYIGANSLALGTQDMNGNLDEFRILKGTALTPDQIRQAYEYGLRTHPITIDFGATLQTSDLISSATDYNFSLTATTSGLSATTSGLYLGDKIIIKENLGGTEYTAQGTVNAINTATGAITVPSWDTGSTFPASNGYSPNATVFKWQREYFDLTGSLSTHRDAITNLTLRPTNGAEGRTIYLDDFRYNTNYLTASSSSAITSGNNRYLQYRAIFTSTDTYVSPFLTAFNTLYTALANSFPAIIGISGGGFLSF